MSSLLPAAHVATLPTGVRAANEIPGGAFGHDPWWLMIIKALFVFVFLLLMTLFTIWFERRVVGRMQQRLGPNRHGPFGLLQPLADGLKAMLKEEIMPRAADKAIFLLAPTLAAFPAFLTFGVIPFGPEVSIFGHHTMLQLADLNVAVIYVLAASSIGIYGIVLAGWSSGSTYPLLGALRSSAQMISYEVAMGLSLAAVFLWSGSMSTSEIVSAQTRVWGLVLIPSFVVYVIAMMGETNRAPFDLPEGESELVGGFQTEYSGFRFAMFYLAEYINMINVSALCTTLFLGGWRAPWPLSLWSGANSGWWPMLWFVVKLVLVLFVFIWVRGTLPRFRYDQFMALGWKVLIPVSLGWVVLVALVRVMNNQGWSLAARIGTIAGVAVVFLVLSSLTGVLARTRDEPLLEPEDVGALSPDYRAPEFASSRTAGHPVPPLPGQNPASTFAGASAFTRTKTEEGGPRG